MTTVAIRRRAAIHEASHVVVGWAAGWSTSSVAIDDFGNGWANVWPDPERRPVLAQPSYSWLVDCACSDMGAFSRGRYHDRRPEALPAHSGRPVAEVLTVLAAGYSATDPCACAWWDSAAVVPGSDVDRMGTICAQYPELHDLLGSVLRWLPSFIHHHLRTEVDALAALLLGTVKVDGMRSLDGRRLASLRAGIDRQRMNDAYLRMSVWLDALSLSPEDRNAA